MGVAQLRGACLVAAATSVIVIAPPGLELRAALFVPAAFIGVAGFGVSRAAGRSSTHSVVVGAVVLLAGLAVAGVKAALSTH